MSGNCFPGLTTEQKRGSYIVSAVDTLQSQVNDVETQVNGLTPYFDYDATLDDLKIGDKLYKPTGQANEVNDMLIGTNLSIGLGNSNTIIGNNILMATVTNGAIAPADIAKETVGNFIVSKTLHPQYFASGANQLIIIAPLGLTPPVPGDTIPANSIILGQCQPSKQHKFQLGGLIPPLAGGPLPGNPDGYIRIRYNNNDFKIPVFADNDDPNP